jgi:chloride channel protein, CIC family
MVEARRGDADEEHSVGLLEMSLLALGVGILTGAGAAVFRALIAFVYNASYLGKFSFFYNANVLDPPSRYGAFVFFSPIIGGLIVVWLVRSFAPEAKGHGVPEVMDSIFYKGGDIRGVVAVVKSLASAISIGTGAAVGREGPIIQIGSSLGSTSARLFGLSTSQKITLLSAGAGAGIAATFNTPLGGVLFAVEILLPEISNRTFLPVVLATGAATYVGRLLLGATPAFHVPDLGGSPLVGASAADILTILALGIACGIAGWAFVRGLAWMEDWFPELPGGPYAQVAFGMAAIGAMMVGFTAVFGHPFVNGVGYGVIQDVLDQHMIVPWLLLLLFAAKLAATSISLGCGASGGVFSPLLFMGASLGGAIGAAAAMISASHLSPAACAMIGMAALVGAGTGGVMTGIVMIFEMTRDYAIIVPVILSVAIAAGVRRSLVRDTIYTIKLRHRGHQVPQDRHANLYLVQRASEIMERKFVAVESGASLINVLQSFQGEPSLMPPVVIGREGRIVGMVPPRSGLWPEALRDPSLTIDRLADHDFVLAKDSDLLSRVFERMKRRQKEAAIVIGGEGVPRMDNICGVITKRSIADAIISAA